MCCYLSCYHATAGCNGFVVGLCGACEEDLGVFLILRACDHGEGDCDGDGDDHDDGDSDDDDGDSDDEDGGGDDGGDSSFSNG